MLCFPSKIIQEFLNNYFLLLGNLVMFVLHDIMVHDLRVVLY